MENSYITDNSAEFGGGIYCNGNSAVSVMDGFIFSNYAEYGGGLYFDECALTFNQNRRGRIFENEAETNGGGLYLKNGAEFFLNSVLIDDFHHLLRDNDAEVYGGGAFVTGSGTKLNLSNASVGFNSAGLSGGAIYASDNAFVRIERDDDACDKFHCSYLSDNQAGQSGGLITIKQSRLEIDRVGIFRNRADEGHGDFLFVDNGVVEITGSILAYHDAQDGDVAADSLIAVSDRGPSAVLGSYLTVADNETESFLHVEESEYIHNIAFGQSILNDQNVTLDFNVNDSSVIFYCNLMAEVASLDQPDVDVDHNIQSLDAGLGGGSYYLRDDSPAIDMCQGAAGEMDYLGNPRGIDHEGVADSNGVYDAGAFEYQYTNPDVIFRDGFDD